MEAGLGDPSGPSPQYVKPGDLSAVIAASHGDFLIVVGDKNMKNETCQARRAGKLVEMTIDERITTLLESWAQQSGIKPGSGVADTDRSIAALGEDALFERLKRLSPATPHIQDRMGRLSALVGEITDMRRGLGGRRGPGGGSVVLGDVSNLTEGDQSVVAKLTRVQTQLVRLHKDCVDALASVRKTPVLPKGATAVPSAPGVPAHLDLGLGGGSIVTVHYRPNGTPVPLGISGTYSSLPAAGAAAGSGAMSSPAVPAAGAIPVALKNRLIALLEGHLSRLEEEGAAVSEAAGGGSITALWNAYYAVSSESA